MTAQIIHLCERRARKMRHVLGTCAAVAQTLDDHAPPWLGAMEQYAARLTRARLIQEAIDEAIANRTDCSYEEIIARVAEMEAML